MNWCAQPARAGRPRTYKHPVTRLGHCSSCSVSGYNRRHPDTISHTTYPCNILQKRAHGPRLSNQKPRLIPVTTVVARNMDVDALPSVPRSSANAAAEIAMARERRTLLRHSYNSTSKRLLLRAPMSFRSVGRDEPRRQRLQNFYSHSSRSLGMDLNPAVQRPVQRTIKAPQGCCLTPGSEGSGCEGLLKHPTWPRHVHSDPAVDRNLARVPAAIATSCYTRPDVGVVEAVTYLYSDVCSR